MISLELSSIQHNSAESARLAAAIEEYQRKGGVIRRVETTAFRPTDANNGLPAVVIGRKALSIKPSAKAMEHKRVKLGSKAERMAEHDARVLPQIIDLLARHIPHTTIADTVGVSRSVLRRIFRTHNIGDSTKSSTAAEKVAIERIKAIHDLGCSRHACCLKLNITDAKLNQLLTDWEIEYPVRYWTWGRQ